MRIIILLILIALAVPGHPAALDFEELEKAPEGAYKGQMFLGFSVSMGSTLGGIIDAEHDFVKGSTHTFEENEVTKRIDLSHLTFIIGADYEYMPLDHLGINIKISRAGITQKTTFGPDYKNWNASLYTDYAFLLGPALHLSERKIWDISLTPSAGYSLSFFKPAPVAQKLINGISAQKEISLHNFCFASILEATLYLSGGPYLSAGFEWSMKMVNFGRKFDFNNGNTAYFEDRTSSQLHNLCFIISAGYCFYN